MIKSFLVGAQSCGPPTLCGGGVRFDCKTAALSEFREVDLRLIRMSSSPAICSTKVLYSPPARSVTVHGMHLNTVMFHSFLILVMAMSKK